MENLETVERAEASNTRQRARKKKTKKNKKTSTPNKMTAEATQRWKKKAQKEEQGHKKNHMFCFEQDPGPSHATHMKDK